MGNFQLINTAIVHFRSNYLLEIKYFVLLKRLDKLTYIHKHEVKENNCLFLLPSCF